MGTQKSFRDVGNFLSAKLPGSRKLLNWIKTRNKLSRRIYDLNYWVSVVLWSDGIREPVEGCFVT